MYIYLYIYMCTYASICRLLRGGLRALHALEFFCSSKPPKTLYCRTKRSNSLLGPLRAACALEFAAPARSEPSKCARKRCSGSLGAADCVRKRCSSSLGTAGRHRKRCSGSLGAADCSRKHCSSSLGAASRDRKCCPGSPSCRLRSKSC